jgi:hypothetical protein
MARTQICLDRQQTFTDHKGRAAYMVWSYGGTRNGPVELLPPLGVAVFYFVHPDFALDGFDPVVFKKAVGYDGDLIDLHQVRIELFFVPGGTAQDCVDHFRGEVAARGDISRQIEEVEKAMQGIQTRTEPSENGGQRLPGLIWPTYRQHAIHIYFSEFFMFEGPSWAESDKDAKVRLVEFDRIPYERYQEFREPSDPRWFPEIATDKTMRIQPRRTDQGWEAEAWDQMYEAWCEGRINREAICGATTGARELGWQSWWDGKTGTMPRL